MGKPFDLRELAARVRALVRSAKRERDRNAVTGLPGSEGIDEQLTARAQNSDCSVAQVAVMGFRAFGGKERTPGLG